MNEKKIEWKCYFCREPSEKLIIPYEPDGMNRLKCLVCFVYMSGWIVGKEGRDLYENYINLDIDTHKKLMEEWEKSPPFSLISFNKVFDELVKEKNSV